MKKRMKKLASLLLSVSMTFSMISFPVYATPADDTENETAVTTESPETEEPADAAGETTEPVAEEQETTQPEPTNPDTTEPEAQQEEEQPTVTPIEENFTGYTVHAEDIDVSGVTPYSVPVEEDVTVDENDPVMSTIEEELQGMTVLDEEGKSVPLTKEQIQQVLTMWENYQDQWAANANVLGVQLPFFLSYNDSEKDGLGVLGEMLVLADVPIEDVRSGKYSFDDLMGMIQNFYYADQFGVKFYGDAIAKKRNAALAEVKKSGAETMAQKMLVLNDWIAHNATFDMSYIMQDDKGNPIMVAQESKEHEHYDEIYSAMHELYTDQITKQFHDQIFAGIEADLRQQYYEGAIKNIIYQQALGKAESAATEDEKAAANEVAKNYMNKNADAISEDAEGFVKTNFGPEAAEQISNGADDFISKAENEGVEVQQGVTMTVEQLTQYTMENEAIVDTGETDENGDPIKIKPNQAIPKFAEQAAIGLTEGILGAWEGNHIGILAEGTGVCAGYSKAFAYLLQYMMPEYYAVEGQTDLSVSENWKTPKELYYDDDGNLDINKDYVVDMVRITFAAETSMFGEPGNFGEVHFWNAVKVGGKWYYVDPCYTDIYVECMSRDRVEIDGTMNHMYFMFSHKTAVEMYDGNMEEIASLYSAEGVTDDSYEDSWFARISSNAYSDGTNFYYLYDSTDQLSMMREFQNMDPGNMTESDFEALLEGSDPEYKLVYHRITDPDVVEGGADTAYTTLIEFNPKDDNDDTTSALVYDPESDGMVENELLTDLFARYKDDCDIYPSIKLTAALYNGKLYFNLSNCILSYEISSGKVEIVKEYNVVSGVRDNTNPFGGMAFSVPKEGVTPDFTFTNHPIAAMTIKNDGNMYVSIATNLGFISGKNAVNDTTSYGYEFEESNYNPNYSNYTQDSDYSDEQLAEMGYSKETNDNDEFMWSAVFVDTIEMGTTCEHNYETVTETFCGRDGYTENRCTKCGAVETGTRVVNEDTACDHHYVRFDETYYTKDSDGNWNTGYCYVCTVCGFAIEEPTKPSEDSSDKQKAEYEKEKKIWDYAVEHHGHTYEPTDAQWSEDSSSVTFSNLQCSSVCPEKKSKLDCLLNDDTISVGLAEETTAEAEVTGHEGECSKGVTDVYTAEGEVIVGKVTYKYTATNKVKQEAGEHSYTAEFTWTSNEDEEAEVPYNVTVGEITCEVCGQKLKGETTVEVVPSEESVPATCVADGTNVYVATATVKAEDGTVLGTVTDEKTDVIEAQGHSYVEDGNDAEHEAWTWSEDHKQASLVLTCTKCGEATEVIEAKVEETPVSASCTEAGATIYTATAEYKDQTYTDEQRIEGEALGHQYTEKWEWKDATEENAEVPYTATLILTCGREGCGDVQEIPAEKVEIESQTPLTCTQDGVTVYKATATFDGTTYTNSDKVDTVKAQGHSYVEDGNDAEHEAWTWSEDHKQASLVLTCTKCGEATEVIEAKVEETPVSASCTEAGATIYTATAEYKDQTYTDEQRIEGEALGHQYTEKWEWKDATEENAEVPYTAILILTCGREGCGDVQEIPAEKVEIESQTPLTCTQDGVTVYKATATFNGETYTNNEKVDTVKAQGHSYVEDGNDAEHEAWTWSEDHKQASLVLTCTKCGEKTEAIEAKVEETPVSASCTEAGATIYTATAEYKDQTYTDEQRVEGEALGHQYTEKWEWKDATEENAEVPYTATLILTCGREGCGDVQEIPAEKVEIESQTPLTCTQDGVTVYKATATFNGETYTNNEKVDTVKAQGHSYVEDGNDAEHEAWTWSEGHKQASLVLTCTKCGEATEVIEAKVEETPVSASCTEAGATIYTATAEYKDQTYTDEQRIEGEALGHQYTEKWEWKDATEENAEVPYTAILILTCGREGCGDVQEIPAEKVEIESQTPLTCTQDGVTVYKATATFNGETYTNNEKVDTVKAQGHSYVEDGNDVEHETWTWSEDYKNATLELTCTSCGEKVKIENQENEEDVVKIEYQTNNATCTVAGTTIYTATAKYEGVTYKDEKTVTDKPLGHDYNTNWNWDQAEDMNAEVPYTATLDLTCKRCDFSDKGIQANVRLKEGSTIPATCDKPGQKTYIAEVQYDETIRFETEQPFYTEAATGHNWSEWETVKEPTETEAGEEQRTCSKCGKVETNKIAPLATPSVQYRTHVQDHGWEDVWKTNGEMSGTSGESRRLEAIEIKLVGSPYEGSIEYSTHIQDIGWQSFKKDGNTSGTEGQSKRLEAIKIRLTGEMKEKYHVYYRVHAQDYGWLGWAKDGEEAGTAGFSKRLEAIEIMLVKDGDEAPKDEGTNPAYIFKSVSYRTHVQDYGWQSYQSNGATSGTTGKSKRLEAIQIKLENQKYSGSIQYKTHIQDIGWETSWKSDNAISGTSGKSKRLEAIRIQLTGEMKKKYDVYYRVHAQSFGWMGWAKNGEPAGTEGYAYRLEGIQIVLVEKDGPAPGTTKNAFSKKK